MMPSSSRMLCSSSTTSTRVSATEGGEAESEDAAGARRRFDVHLAPVILENPVDEREAQSAAVGLRREEWLEDVIEVVARDALAGVGHAHLEPSAHDGPGHPQLAAVGHGLDGVEAQVPDGLAELLWVHDPLEGRRKFAPDLQRAGRRAMLEQQEDLVDRLDDVHAHPRQRRRPRVLEEVAQDAVQTARFLENDLREPLTQIPRRSAAREDLDRPRQRGEGIPDLMRDVRRHSSAGGMPMVAAAGTPVMVAAARLNVVIVPERSRAISPVPTDSNTRSLIARRSRSVRLCVWKRSARPPATMATTRNVPAFANIVTISRAVVSCGGSKNQARGRTVRPKTRPV